MGRTPALEALPSEDHPCALRISPGQSVARRTAPKRDARRAQEKGRNAYKSATLPLSPNAAGKHLIKEAFKREFPRSNKLYLMEIKTSAS